MTLGQFPPTNRNTDSEANRSSLENDRTPVTTTPSLSDRDSERPPEYSSSDTLRVAEKSKAATTKYIYYRIYAEDGAIPSKTPVSQGDQFLGRIKTRSVPPARIAKTVKCSIATVENIKDGESTSLFLTPYNQSPMDDADKFDILNGTGPGSTPQEPLALVAKMSGSERSALESEQGRGGLASTAQSDKTSPEIRYVYYLLYANNFEMPSKTAIDKDEPSLGRIRADSVAPPHTPTSIKRCISRVEGNPALAYADLFANTTCDTPLQEERHISILPTDGPGMSPNEPISIVHVKNPSIPDGRYVIKSRAWDIYWKTEHNPISRVRFWPCPMNYAMNYVKKCNDMQWDITQDANGNISITSPYAPSSWVGAEITGSTVPVPWRLIPVDDKFYYLTTDMNRNSQNPRVPVSRGFWHGAFASGSMDTLKEGDPWQMWEFIPIL